jgi:hypothetical protein
VITKENIMAHYQYPLQLRFKLIAFAPRIIVTDASGNEILYVHQKTFALKEDVRIYRDQTKSEEVYRINAESILDFSTRYNISEAGSGKEIGNIKSKGWRSIWKATYLLSDASDHQTHTIEEDNPWVKVGDALLGEIPILGMFTGYFMHPSYTTMRTIDSSPIMKITKEPAFFEGVYSIDLLDPQASYEEEIRSLMGMLLLIQFMRRRG